jgi:hypothetical protein
VLSCSQDGRDIERQWRVDGTPTALVPVVLCLEPAVCCPPACPPACLPVCLQRYRRAMVGNIVVRAYDSLGATVDAAVALRTMREPSTNLAILVRVDVARPRRKRRAVRCWARRGVYGSIIGWSSAGPWQSPVVTPPITPAVTLPLRVLGLRGLGKDRTGMDRHRHRHAHVSPAVLQSSGWFSLASAARRRLQLSFPRHLYEAAHGHTAVLDTDLVQGLVPALVCIMRNGK